MIAFSLFWHDVYRYGIMYLISFIVWYIVLYFIGKSKVLDNHPKIQEALTKDIDTLLILIIIGVMFGGRLGYVLIYDRAYFAQNIGEILAVWQWGMSFIGWMIGVVLAISIRWYKKKWGKVDLLVLFDSILSIAPFGIILWRIGNFLNQEIYGIIVTEHFRWLSPNLIQLATERNIFYIYETIDNQLRLNTNFISAFFEWFIMLLLCGWMMLHHIIYKKTIIPGRISALFIASYGFIRFFLEYIRVDSQSEFIRLFTKSQYFFIIFMILGWYLLRTHRHESIQE